MSTKKEEFALAWRDKHIRALEQALAGLEEQQRLLYGFLKVLILRNAKEGVCRITKQELKQALDTAILDVRADEQAYLIGLAPVAAQGAGARGGDGAQ